MKWREQATRDFHNKTACWPHYFQAVAAVVRAKPGCNWWHWGRVLRFFRSCMGVCILPSKTNKQGVFDWLILIFVCIKPRKIKEWVNKRDSLLIKVSLPTAPRSLKGNISNMWVMWIQNSGSQMNQPTTLKETSQSRPNFSVQAQLWISRKRPLFGTRWMTSLYFKIQPTGPWKKGDAEFHKPSPDKALCLQCQLLKVR